MLRARSLSDFGRWLEGLLLPWHCLLCGAPGINGIDLCIDCFHDLPVNRNACRRCAAALPVDSRPGLACGRCLLKPPAQASTHAPYLYGPPLDYLILAMKFKSKVQHARTLGEILLRTGAELPRPECLVPVPLHSSRLRERGFNQALEIARPVARGLKLPVLPAHLRRVRATPPQSLLDLSNRQKNLKDAFQVTRPIPYAHVALIDDVVTTGATVSSATRALLSSGVERVDVWCVAHTPEA